MNDTNTTLETIAKIARTRLTRARAEAHRRIEAGMSASLIAYARGREAEAEYLLASIDALMGD